MSLGMPGMSTHKPSVLNLVSTLRCVGACVGCNPVITLLQSLKSPVTFSAQALGQAAQVLMYSRLTFLDA